MPTDSEGYIYREKVLVQSTDNISDGQTVTIVPATIVGGYKYLKGECKSDRNLSIKIYQGSHPTDMEYKDTVTVPANSAEGAGAGFDMDLIGDYVKVTISNASGADTSALEFEAKLRM